MRVVNIYKEKHDIYIGRPTVFGNPFLIGRDGTRKEVIEKFEVYARKNKALLEFIKNLHKDVRLGCYCKPQDCHGDIIVKLWKEMHNV